ncbi:type II/IV secretion system protein [Candidatus Uhrbacteria bacterium]|nr:type II/IV secretion system protein [Candidatus Uhrbacteria bacterium]
MATTRTKKKEESVGQEKLTEAPMKVPTREHMDEHIKKALQDKTGKSTAKLYLELMIFAHASRASDIHLEPGDKTAMIRLRVDGILGDTFTIPMTLHARLIALLKIRAHMRTDEHRAPQDGRDKFETPTGSVDVRASVMPTIIGEKAVLRLLSSESHKLTLEQLGFEKTDYDKILRAIHHPWGMILTTGPTGSGKTTTIYAILEILNKRAVNISTIEDPVEFYIPGVNQSQVDRVAKLTFANGLRSLLRQDPDIIMVGEIRDEETAQIAVNAALTGHKLLSTLHTNNAATTIPRLIDMGVEPFLLASTLVVSVSQRLLRRACDACQIKKSFKREELSESIDLQTLDLLFGKKKLLDLIDVTGCKHCNGTGYLGRIGIYEVLEVTEEIQRLVLQRASSESIHTLALEQGMTSLVDNAIQKVLSNETTISEFVRVMQD